MVSVGQEAPDFKLRSSTGESVTLSQFRGQKNVVISWHIMSFTGGWTHQCSDFRLQNKQFESIDTQVLGVSVDSAPVQKAYSASLGGLPYPVLADFHPKGQMSDSFGVYNEERGVSKRAIVIVDKEGIVRFHRIYEGELPEAKDILEEVKAVTGAEWVLDTHALCNAGAQVLPFAGNVLGLSKKC